MSWHSTLQLLSLPIPHLLIGPYASPSPLPPLSPTSFLPTTPLTTRLRHTDLILYSLLTTLDPSLLRTLPSWPPLTQLDSKAFKAELGKVVEQLLKKENKRGLGWEREVSWRRSYLDEAKGDKWEHVLLWLTTLALRRVVEEQRNVLQGAEVASDLSPDTIATTTALLRSTYRTEAQLATSLVRQREAELATLRLAGRELLQTRAELASDKSVKRGHTDLDLKHLEALRDRQANTLPEGVWALLSTGDPSQGRSEVRQDEFRAAVGTRLAGGHSTSPSLATEFNVASHLSLLSSLATLSDAPALAPLPSTSDASAPTSSPLTAHPTAWSLALGREQDRLAALPHPSPPPTSRHQPQSTRNLSLLFPSTSSTSSHLSSTLLRSTSPTESIESRLASLLDSLEPNPTTKAEPVRAPLAPLRRSKLPARTTAPPLRGDVKGEGGRGAGEGVVQGLRVEKLGLQRDLGERGARASKEGQSLMLELLGDELEPSFLAASDSSRDVF